MGDPLLIGRIILHYLCLIREIVSLILTRVLIQRWVMTWVVIQPLNHKFKLIYIIIKVVGRDWHVPPIKIKFSLDYLDFLFYTFYTHGHVGYMPYPMSVAHRKWEQRWPSG